MAVRRLLAMLAPLLVILACANVADATRGVNAGWLGQWLVLPPFAYTGVLAGGQSLSTGTTGSPVLDSGPDPFGVLAIKDDAGYDAAGGGYQSGYFDAGAPTVYIGNGASPIRPLVTGSSTQNDQYPGNVQGETPDHCYAYQLASYAADAGTRYPTVVLGEVGSSGQPLSGLETGTPSWNGVAFFAQAGANLLGPSFGVGSIPFTHGEADSANQSLTYGTDLETYVTGIRALIYARTGQTYVPRVIQTQQHSEPASGYGEPTADNGQWSASVADRTIVLAGPKYQFGSYYSTTGGPHMVNTGYCLVGELDARAEWSEESGVHFQPVWPTSFVRSSNVVTIAYHVPAPSTALVFDGTNGVNMHASGPWASWWGNEYGFEAYDQQLSGYVSAVTNDGGLFEVTWSQAHGLSTGSQIFLHDAWSVPSLEGFWTVTVVDSTHFTLNGSTYSTGFTLSQVKTIAWVPIAISGVTVSGNVVTLTLARAPVGATLELSYAWFTDLAVNQQSYAAGWIGGTGRGGALRGNAVALTGARSGISQYDWAIAFQQNVP